MRRPPIQSAARSALFVVLLALVTGCTVTTAPTDAGSAAGRGGGPARSSAAPSAPAPGPLDLDRVDTRARSLDRALTHALAGCMRTHRFPQLSDTMTAGDSGPRLRRPVLGVHAVELGPTTAAQAERYGMLGTSLLFTDPPRPIVRSTAPAYDAALTECMREVRDAPVIFERLAGWRTLTNELRQELLTRIDPSVRKILRRQLSCVRRTGYPALPIDTLLDGDTRTAMRTLHIPVGNFSADPADPPPLAPDTTEIIPAPPEQTYLPTEAEVALALTYVRCGRTTRLEAAMTRAVGPVAKNVLTAHTSDVDSYDAYFADRLSKLGSTG